MNSYFIGAIVAFAAAIGAGVLFLILRKKAGG